MSFLKIHVNVRIGHGFSRYKILRELGFPHCWSKVVWRRLVEAPDAALTAACLCKHGHGISTFSARYLSGQLRISQIIIFLRSNLYVYPIRRKFRSETSDNMDR